MLRNFKGYTNLVEIGRGGMATVYRATSPAGSIVALKMLAATRISDPVARKRFEQEVMLGVNLDHPNIVKVLDYSLTPQNGEAPFIVMEYVAGESLDRKLLRGRSVPPEQFEGYLRDMAAALDHAHAVGIVHRDIKPSNVLIRHDGRAMLADFGIAKGPGASHHTQTQARVGSVYYMSPEQAGGAPELTPASDIYSLAVTAFHALCGRQPFVAESEVAIARMHIEQLPPHLEDINPAIPKPVCSAILSALAKDPAERPGTASALALSFSQALKQPPDLPLGDLFHSMASRTLPVPSIPAQPKRVSQQAVLAPQLVTAHHSHHMHPPRTRVMRTTSRPALARKPAGFGRLAAAISLIALPVLGGAAWMGVNNTETASQPNDIHAGQDGNPWGTGSGAVPLVPTRNPPTPIPTARPTATAPAPASTSAPAVPAASATPTAIPAAVPAK